MSTSTHSPSNHERKTTLGTLVHLLGLFTGFIGAGLVYLVTENKFTKENARNALNWQIFFTIIFIVFMMITGLDTFYSVLIGGLGMAIFFFILNPIFCVWATVKANNGAAWKYPIVPELVDKQ